MGNFFGTVVDFIIIAFFVFVVTKALLREKPGPAMKTCPACGEGILAKATRCKRCTSGVEGVLDMDGTNAFSAPSAARARSR